MSQIPTTYIPYADLGNAQQMIGTAPQIVQVPLMQTMPIISSNANQVVLMQQIPQNPIFYQLI